MQQNSRVTRSVIATVPLVLVGSLALSIAAAPAAEAAPARKSVKQKSVVHKQVAQKQATRAKASAPSVRAASVPSTYRVTAGDTVGAISTRFGLSTASVLAANGLGWQSVIHAGQVLKLTGSPASSATTAASTTSAATKYTIASGDTISAIAKKFGVSAAAIMTANKLVPSSIVYPGAVLTIPGAAAPAHTAASQTAGSKTGATIATQTASSVKKLAATPTATNYAIATGDTVSSIAKKFGVSTAAILSANGMTGSSLIYAGRVITIPTLSVYLPGRGVITVLTAEMESNARTIVSVGRSLGVSDRGIVIALATAMQESALRNLDYGHLDSVGLFQQRPSIGWGSTKQLLDPTYASLLFYGGPSSPNRSVVRGLLDVPGWQSMSVTKAAQAVQVSAYPKAYAQWEQSATFWLSQLR